MRIDLTDVSPVKKTMTIEVPPEEVARETDSVLRSYAAKAKIPGFRKGKVPRSVLERMYGPSLAEQIEQTLVGETLMDAVETVGLEAVAEPSIEATPPAPDVSFRYTARIEVKPQVELPDLEGLAAQRPSVCHQRFRRRGLGLDADDTA